MMAFACWSRALVASAELCACGSSFGTSSCCWLTVVEVAIEVAPDEGAGEADPGESRRFILTGLVPSSASSSSLRSDELLQADKPPLWRNSDCWCWPSDAELGRLGGSVNCPCCCWCEVREFGDKEAEESISGFTSSKLMVAGFRSSVAWRRSRPTIGGGGGGS